MNQDQESGGHVPAHRPPVQQSPGGIAPLDEMDPDVFAADFGESIARTLDLETWTTGFDLNALHERLEQEVGEALEADRRHQPVVRTMMFPQIAKPHWPWSGVFRATPKQLIHVQRHILFNGAVDAVDGVSVVHDTLPVTIAQVGVCVASYSGNQGSWSHRMFRRDLRTKELDEVQEMIAVLERRGARSGLNQPGGGRDRVSNLLRRGLMTYAERAVLLKKCSAPWRMGHGHPTPFELLTSSAGRDVLRASTDVLRELVLEHKRFVFVPSEPSERLFLSIGNALHPREYALIETDERRMYPVISGGDIRDPYHEDMDEFYQDVAPSIVVGVYRTFMDTPPQLFYAHKDHAHEAALIAMADSILQPQRNFPALIDLADNVCRSQFGAEGFHATVEAAYARKGEPLKYLSERATRT